MPGFTSLSDETLSHGPSPYDLSCWWDVKRKHYTTTFMIKFLIAFCLHNIMHTINDNVLMAFCIHTINDKAFNCFLHTYTILCTLLIIKFLIAFCIHNMMHTINDKFFN